MISIKLRLIVIFAIYLLLHFFYLFVVVPLSGTYINVYKLLFAIFS